MYGPAAQGAGKLLHNACILVVQNAANGDVDNEKCIPDGQREPRSSSIQHDSQRQSTNADTVAQMRFACRSGVADLVSEPHILLAQQEQLPLERSDLGFLGVQLQSKIAGACGRPLWACHQAQCNHMLMLWRGMASPLCLQENTGTVKGALAWLGIGHLQQSSRRCFVSAWALSCDTTVCVLRPRGRKLG